MEKLKKYLPITLMFVAGLLIGGLAVHQLEWLTPSHAESNASFATDSETSPPAAPTSLNDVDIAKLLNNKFYTIAEAAQPSVVTIFTDRVIQRRDQSPFPFEDHPFSDFFERFFSPRNPDGEQRLRGMGSGVIVGEGRYVLTNHHVVRGWLGVIIQNVDENLKNAMDLPSTEGVLISEVKENGPADKAGIESGDMVLALDGEKMSDVTRLRNEIASRAPGTKAKLRIFRNGEEKVTEVTLGQLPESDATPATRKNTLDKLGFGVQTLDDNLASRLGYDASEEGVVIMQIDQTGAAFEAGLRQGDVIKRVNRQRVATAERFGQIVENLKSGDTILIHAKRRQTTFYAAFELE